MQNKNEVYELLKDKFEKVYLDEPMKKHTSFKTGGNADILIIPAMIEEVIYLVEFCAQKQIEYIVIGNGTNLLVKDGGIRKLVIKIDGSIGKIKINNEKLIVQAGASVIGLSHFAMNNGLSGLEFACGIPGTLGGAVKMNAGAFKGEFSDVVTNTMYITKNGSIGYYNKDQHNFGYRDSIFVGNDDLIILECCLELKATEIEEIKTKMDHNNAIRKEKQPLTVPSAGSTFKRPDGQFPGQLIEECGLKGYKIGGAEVSKLHANFIINSGNATSKNILDLILYIQEKVSEKFGILLEPEIKVIGEDA